MGCDDYLFNRNFSWNHYSSITYFKNLHTKGFALKSVNYRAMGKIIKSSAKVKPGKNPNSVLNDQKPIAQLKDNRSESILQQQLASMLNSKNGKESIQRVGSEEEELQMKSMGEEEEIQMAEMDEEEEMQMKLEDGQVQMAEMEEDELQMMGMDEEDELQMATLEEEDELQMKLVDGQVQLAEMEEEELQMKGVEDEEELQLKEKSSASDTSNLIGGEDSLQRKENQTGLPDQLKSGVENLSGYSLDDVKVHYNSKVPTQLHAHAFAQGTQIHIAPGQEKHLAHEAWHVVQQKQGRVKPTRQLKGKVNVNDDEGLEKEADTMGAKALQVGSHAQTRLREDVEVNSTNTQLVVQKVNKKERPVFDEKVSELIQQTKTIVTALAKKGEDWEAKYREKGKEKAETKTKGLISGEKEETNYPKEALKLIWGQLSYEEKFEIAKEVGGSLWEAMKQMPSLPDSPDDESESSGSIFSIFGSREKESDKPKKDKRPKKDKGESEPEASSSLIADALKEVTLDDAKQAYELYQKYKKINKKIEEVKGKAIEASGKVGGEVGGFFGDIRNRIEFAKQFEGQRREFMMARKRYEVLKGQVEGDPRYKAQLDALSDSLINIQGPGRVFLGIEESWNQEYFEVCAIALHNLRDSESKFRKLIGAVEETAKEVGAFLGLTEKPKEDAPQLEKPESLEGAHASMLSKLTTVTNKSWSSKTFFFFTPKGISEIKSLISKGGDPDKILAKVKAKAESFGGLDKSANRSAETQILYDALTKVNLEDLNSVWAASSKLDDVAGMI
jgi:hypothetical protein